jgi:NitT/TauT family transport system substrate-binding protein
MIQGLALLLAILVMWPVGALRVQSAPSVPGAIIVGAPFSIIDVAPLLIGVKKGFYKETGLAMEVRDIRTGTKVMEAGLAGEVNVGITNVVSFMNAVARGTGQVAIMQMAYVDILHRSHGFMIRKALWDAGQVRRIADLKGRRLAIQAWGSVVEPATDAVLRMDGLTRRDVTLVELAYPDQGPAIAAGRIDASVIPDPLLTLNVDRGYAVKLQDPQLGGQLDPLIVLALEWYASDLFPIAVTWAMEDLVKANPDGVRKFIAATQKANVWIRANKDEAAAIVADATKLPLDVVKRSGWSGFDVRLFPREMQIIADKMFETKMLDRKIDVSRAIFRQ